MKEAVCITFAATSEKWIQPLLNYPMCLLTPRTNYLRPNGTKVRGITKGSMLTYLGKSWDLFRRQCLSHNVGKVFFPAT